MRPLVRTLKHALLAVIMIVSGICVMEVGLRAHRLQTVLDGGTDATGESLVRPCPLAYQHLPMAFRGTHRSEQTGTLVEVNTNSIGLRGPEILVPKPAGTFRIVCLGDEATVAPDIDVENTFCRIIEETLQPGFEARVEVINAGQPGHCPLLSLAWARARLVGLQPDLVILCCDVSDPSDDRRYRPLAKFDAAGQLLSVGHPATRERPNDWLSAVEDEFLLARLLGEHLGEQIAGPSEPFETHEADHERGGTDDAATDAGHPLAVIDQTWEPLASLQGFCRQISADFVVTVVPSAQTVRSVEAMQTSAAPDRIAQMIQLLADRANRERIPLLDASPEFAANEGRSRLFLKSSGALATEGHRLFGEILGQALRDRSNRQSEPATLPVSGEEPAVPLNSSPSRSSPLRALERRPRAADGWP